MLIKFVTNDIHKERLQELVSSEGQTDLYAYNFKERRTYLEVKFVRAADINSAVIYESMIWLQVLRDFNASGLVPLDYLVELIPRLQPRQFSISSSPHVSLVFVPLCL